jgi:hypothetical protein
MALTENTYKNLSKIFKDNQGESNIILFIQIQGEEQLSGVCKIKEPRLDLEVRDHWRQLWQGTFKAIIQVDWMIPFCSLPFGRIQHLIQPEIAKTRSLNSWMNIIQNNSGGQILDPESEYNSSVIKSIIELPLDSGHQISKMYVELDKQKTQEKEQGIDQLKSWIEE